MPEHCFYLQNLFQREKLSSGSRLSYLPPFLWKSCGQTQTFLRLTVQAWPCRAVELQTWWLHCWPWGCVAGCCGPCRFHWNYDHWALVRCIYVQLRNQGFQHRGHRWMVCWGKRDGELDFYLNQSYLVDWIEKLSLVSPMEYLWPSMVHKLIPHLVGSPLASCGIYCAGLPEVSFLHLNIICKNPLVIVHFKSYFM